MDTRGIELQVGPIDAPLLHTPGGVSMGNPHVVFFVDHAPRTAPCARPGPLVEHHPLFPEGVNVGFAHVTAPDHIRLRVWERGAGLTKACGTGACAALVASARRGLTGRSATLEVDGGDLFVSWDEATDHVLMTGPVVVERTGTLRPLTPPPHGGRLARAAPAGMPGAEGCGTPLGDRSPFDRTPIRAASPRHLPPKRGKDRDRAGNKPPARRLRAANPLIRLAITHNPASFPRLM